MYGKMPISSSLSSASMHVQSCETGDNIKGVSNTLTMSTKTKSNECEGEWMCIYRATKASRIINNQTNYILPFCRSHSFWCVSLWNIKNSDNKFCVKWNVWGQFQMTFENWMREKLKSGWEDDVKLQNCFIFPLVGAFNDDGSERI
jgi:hypothetical protein